MIDKQTARTRIEHLGIIPAVRVTSRDDAMFAAETVAAAGIPIVEITMTIPDAVHVIRDLAIAAPDLIVGAGTVLDVDTAARCVGAGATFVTSPGVDVRTIEFLREARVLTIPGVMTPTDIMAAIHAGADLVKIFPCAPLGGPAYLKTLSAPFPSMACVAAGGVDQRTAAEYIHAGAVAVGVGSELIPRRAVHQRDARWIGELVHRFLGIIGDARTSTGRLRPG
jgi:2-dehydro-3-deoxyphosphogluconate aldolase/(4S)-4-hydroxy-2-oxoglutarate aldolase